MRKTLFLLLLFLLSGCSSTPEEDSSARMQTLTVALSPAVNPMSKALYSCADTIPDTLLLVDETPIDLSNLQTVDLALRLGEPSELPPFAAQLAWEEVVIVTHASNTTSLSIGEVADLFSGRVESWEEFNFSGDEVQVWVTPRGEETREIFEREVTRGSPITPKAMLAPSPEAMLEAVSGDPAAIGFLPRAWVSEEVNSFELGIRQPILALAAGEPQGATRALLTCLQGESGQEIIGENYGP